MTHELVHEDKKGSPTTPRLKKAVQHDETPALISDHKFEAMGEWYTRCRHCKLAEAAHAQSVIRYYGDDNPEP
jgi:hypothetical protein